MNNCLSYIRYIKFLLNLNLLKDFDINDIDINIIWKLFIEELY